MDGGLSGRLGFVGVVTVVGVLARSGRLVEAVIEQDVMTNDWFWRVFLYCDC